MRGGVRRVDARGQELAQDLWDAALGLEAGSDGGGLREGGLVRGVG